MSEARDRAVALLHKYTKSFSDIPLASGQEVLRLQAESRTGGPAVTLIDVRDAAEQLVSMLPGAITAADFEADPQRFRDSVCIPYCTIGYRSGMYCRRLLSGALSISPAAVLNGEGVVLWSHDVGLFSGGAKRLHCYGREWDVAASGFTTITYSPKEQVAAIPTFLREWLTYTFTWLRVLLRRCFA